MKNDNDTQFAFKIDNEVLFTVQVPQGVFLPTFTSVLCVKAARTRARPNSDVLDLGCGSGVVGIAVAKLLGIKEPLCASDISETAVAAARRNFESFSISCDVRAGSLFEPWQGMSFDFVLDDVSGIAEDVAALSPWFEENIPCATGPDGADLTIKVLETAPRFLRPNGGLFIPVISLSDTRRILGEARKNFAIVEKAAQQTWAMPAPMMAHIDQLRKIRDDGRIHFDERFGSVLCSTEIYYCTSDQ